MDCIFRNITGSGGLITDQSFIRSIGPLSERAGELVTSGCQQCFTIWTAASREIVGQGCWYDEDSCTSNTCQSKGRLGASLEFCCCTGDVCNKEFKTGEVIAEPTSPSPSPTTTTPNSIVCLTASEEYLLTNILLGVLLGLVLTTIIVIWRLCKTCRSSVPGSGRKERAGHAEISASQINLIPPSPPQRKNSTPPPPSSAASFYRRHDWLNGRPLLPPKICDISAAAVVGGGSTSYYYKKSFSRPLLAAEVDTPPSPQPPPPLRKKASTKDAQGRRHNPAAAAISGSSVSAEQSIQNLYARIHMHGFVARNLALAKAQRVHRNLDNIV